MTFDIENLPWIELKNQKLPKQWRHWAKLAGLNRSYTKSRSPWNWFTLKGRGHLFRIDMYGHFEISCPVVDFDRWANSHGPAIGHMPKSKAEFLAAVKFLIEAERSARESEQRQDEEAQTSASQD